MATVLRTFPGPDPFIDRHLRTRFGPHQSPNTRDWKLAERVAILERVGSLDGSLEALTLERRSLLDRLDVIREELWPLSRMLHKRIPNLDERPQAPPVPGAEVLNGAALRSTCLMVLASHGTMGLGDLAEWLHRYGYRVGGRRPVQRLGDAMAFEVRANRAVRVGRGVYAIDARVGVSAVPMREALPWAAVPGDDERGLPVDPAVRRDPERWQPEPWTSRDPADDVEAAPPSPTIADYVKFFQLARARAARLRFPNPRAFTPLRGDSSTNRSVRGQKRRGGGRDGAGRWAGGWVSLGDVEFTIEDPPPHP